MITKKAFERMKINPEWEKHVMNFLKKMYSVNGLPAGEAVGYQLIGASPEECYGYVGPVRKVIGKIYMKNHGGKNGMKKWKN